MEPRPRSTGRHTRLIRFHALGEHYTNVSVLGCVEVVSAFCSGRWAVTSTDTMQQTTSCPASLSHRTASPGKSSSARNSMPTGFQCELANLTTRSDFSTSLASNRHAAMSSRVTPG